MVSGSSAAFITLGASALLAMPSALPQTAPHDFAGNYKGSGNASGNTAEIVPTGAPNQYKVTIQYGAMTAGGEYISDQIEETASARGNLLPIRNKGDGQLCQMNFVANSAGGRYRLSGCYDADGWYSRTSSPSAASAYRVPGAAPTNAPTPTWLVGAWVPQGGYCQSGDTFSIDKDGTYSAGYSISGTWRLTGNTLSLVYRESEPGDEPGPTQRENHPVVRVNANELTLATKNYRRCPANGGVEPWHSRERFMTK